MQVMVVLGSKIDWNTDKVNNATKPTVKTGIVHVCLNLIVYKPLEFFYQSKSFVKIFTLFLRYLEIIIFNINKGVWLKITEKGTNEFSQRSEPATLFSEIYAEICVEAYHILRFREYY